EPRLLSRQAKEDAIELRLGFDCLRHGRDVGRVASIEEQEITRQKRQRQKSESHEERRCAQGPPQSKEKATPPQSSGSGSPLPGYQNYLASSLRPRRISLAVSA